MRHRFAVAASLAWCAFAATSTMAQPLPTYPNLPYATVGTQQLMLDLYLPTNATPPFPLVVHIHGGGWSGGSRYPIPAVPQQLLQNGFAVASVSYRLTSQAGQYGRGVSVTFPAQIHDVKGAVRWLRAHASEYNLDPARFGSFGTSAGGHLSALLGSSGNVASLEGDVGGNLGFSSRVQACGDYFGPTDILHINLDVATPPGSTINHDAPNSPESRLVGWDGIGQGIGDIRANVANPAAPYPALVLACNRVNPISFVSADDPQYFIGHGTADTSVPIMQSTRLNNALAAIAHPHEYVQAPGFGHGYLGPATDAQAVAFFRRVLRKPGDVTTDGEVNVDDLLVVVGSWGPCPSGSGTCLADIYPHAIGDDVVTVDDLLSVIVNWG